MDDSYKTMKRVGIRESGNGYRGVYECRVCHGKVYDKDPVSPSDRESIDSRVSEMTCKLCDESAPLSERYWMALATLACASMKDRGEYLKGADIGFPAFDLVYIDGVDDTFFSVEFTLYGLRMEALPNQIGLNLSYPGQEQRSLDSALDDRHELDGPKRLAQEVVDRVRHDLKLKYAKEA